MNLNFLVTGAGAPGIKGTLYSLKNSAFWRDSHIVGVDIDEYAVGRYFLDGFHVVPTVDAVDYNETIVSIARKENIDLVVPQTTKEIQHFSQHLEFFHANGVKVMVSGQEAIACANDKYRLLCEFKAAGLPVPEFSLVRSYAELIAGLDLLGYPDNKAVIKPPISNGSRGVRILSEQSTTVNEFLNSKPDAMGLDLHQLARLFADAEQFPELILMEYLPGEEWSVDVFRSRDGSRCCIIPRVRNRIRSGIAFETTVTDNSELVSMVQTISDRLNLTGAFGFQFKQSSYGAMLLLESNPRIQGTMAASTFAGANIIAMACADYLDLPYDVPSSKQVAWGAEFRRTWGGMGVMQGEFLGEI